MIKKEARGEVLGDTRVEEMSVRIWGKEKNEVGMESVQQGESNKE